MPCPDLIPPPRAHARLPCRVPAPAQTRLWYTAQPANLAHSLTGTNRHEITPRATQLTSCAMAGVTSQLLIRHQDQTAVCTVSARPPAL